MYLSRPREQYIQTILSPNSWGGAIGEWFPMELNQYSFSTLFQSFQYFPGIIVQRLLLLILKQDVLTALARTLLMHRV